MTDRLLGLYWGGHLDSEGVTHSAAYFKMTRVQTIVDTVKEANGDLTKAANILNYDDFDPEPDDPFRITPQEIAHLIEFASDHPVEVTKRLGS